MVDVSNQSDCINMYIKKILRSEMKGKQRYAKKRIDHECKGLIEKSASLLMPDSDPRDEFFYLALTLMINPYILFGLQVSKKDS